VTSEAGVYNDLLLMVWLCEFDEEDFRGQVVDVRDTQSSEGLGKFMRYDLDL
jgi:hypothetical protein